LLITSGLVVEVPSHLLQRLPFVRIDGAEILQPDDAAFIARLRSGAFKVGFKLGAGAHRRFAFAASRFAFAFALAAFNLRQLRFAMETIVSLDTRGSQDASDSSFQSAAFSLRIGSDFFVVIVAPPFQRGA
jgi:hypothetical protein